MKDNSALLKEAEYLIFNGKNIDDFLKKIEHIDPIIYLEVLQYVLFLQEIKESEGL